MGVRARITESSKRKEGKRRVWRWRQIFRARISFNRALERMWWIWGGDVGLEPGVVALLPESMMRGASAAAGGDQVNGGVFEVDAEEDVARSGVVVAEVRGSRLSGMLLGDGAQGLKVVGQVVAVVLGGDFVGVEVVLEFPQADAGFAGGAG